MIVRGRRVDDPLDGRRKRFDFTDPRDPFVGANTNHAVIVRAIEQADIGILNAQVDGFDIGDLHR